MSLYFTIKFPISNTLFNLAFLVSKLNWCLCTSQENFQFQALYSIWCFWSQSSIGVFVLHKKVSSFKHFIQSGVFGLKAQSVSLYFTRKFPISSILLNLAFLVSKFNRCLCTSQENFQFQVLYSIW